MSKSSSFEIILLPPCRGAVAGAARSPPRSAAAAALPHEGETTVKSGVEHRKMTGGGRAGAPKRAPCERVLAVEGADWTDGCRGGHDAGDEIAEEAPALAFALAAAAARTVAAAAALPPRPLVHELAVAALPAAAGLVVKHAGGLLRLATSGAVHGAVALAACLGRRLLREKAHERLLVAHRKPRKCSSWSNR